jgi:hypothetical protein
MQLPWDSPATTPRQNRRQLSPTKISRSGTKKEKCAPVVFSKDEENELLRRQPFAFVRKQIRDQVEDCLWLNALNSLRDELQQQKQESANATVLERCMVCTLPCGTCIHTQTWIEDKFTKDSKAEILRRYGSTDEIDDEMDVVMDVMDSLQFDLKDIPRKNCHF